MDEKDTDETKDIPFAKTVLSPAAQEPGMEGQTAARPTTDTSRANASTADASTKDWSVPGTSTVKVPLDQTPTVSDLPTAKGGDGSPPNVAPTPGWPSRYDDIGPIDEGGFGEVRRVYDQLLKRSAAMKLLRVEHLGPNGRERFLSEARITAQLDHPGIVAVHDQGELSDGRLWFVMKEVRGRTFEGVIRALHSQKAASGFGDNPTGWTFRRLIDAFARVAQAVAYAHSHGIIHRDLKPGNLMVGDLGEAFVMDWGIARLLKHEDKSPENRPVPASSPESDDLRDLTESNVILGTPRYMSPEQASGRRELQGPHTDVFSLGAILYQILSGYPPYHEYHPKMAVFAAKLGPPARLEELTAGGPPVPDELIAICNKAMQHEIQARYSNAGELARDVLDWLDGTQRREHAIAMVERARAEQPRIAARYAEEEREREKARSLLNSVLPHEPIEKKRAGWTHEDEAARLRHEAVLAETKWLQDIHGALSLDADLAGAHELLSDHYRERLAEAERAHRDDDAARFEALLRAHDRGKHAAVLRGDGWVSLVTDPPDAEILAERFELYERRLVPQPAISLGRTPLRETLLSKGSYLLRIRAEGRAEVPYPVLVERGGHWDGAPPGSSEPASIFLPRAEEIASDERLVPAGWCWMGGDPMAADSLPERRVWVDGFIMKRHPVTNEEYLAFLNALVQEGRESEAIEACPRRQQGLADGTQEIPALRRDSSGLFVLPQEPIWDPLVPIVQIDWRSAVRYCQWLARRTTKSWRLPNELEREKAARGVDGRLLPWGDFPEATFARVSEGQEEAASRESVDGHPTDESVYGIRGLAGNVRDWCENPWLHSGPILENDRLVVETEPVASKLQAVKGGSWNSAKDQCRSACRFGLAPGLRRSTIGFRAVRSWPTAEPRERKSARLH